jgi:hypothetical protein
MAGTIWIRNLTLPQDIVQLRLREIMLAYDGYQQMSIDGPKAGVALSATAVLALNFRFRRLPDKSPSFTAEVYVVLLAMNEVVVSDSDSILVPYNLLSCLETFWNRKCSNPLI